MASSVPPARAWARPLLWSSALIAALHALAGDRLDPRPSPGPPIRTKRSTSDCKAVFRTRSPPPTADAISSTIDPYPEVDVRALNLASATWDALAGRIVTVYLGVPHRSSSVHELVIAHLARSDGARLLAPLRAAARQAADALVAGDVDRYGEAMIANTEAQAALHPALVNPLAWEVIERANGAARAGWKVNGAWR